MAVRVVLPTEQPINEWSEQLSTGLSLHIQPVGVAAQGFVREPTNQRCRQLVDGDQDVYQVLGHVQ